MSDTNTSIAIRQLPAYMQNYDEALLAQIFGTPDANGVLQGGIMDAEAYPDLFSVPDYVQAGEDPLQTAVANTFSTEADRQAFMDRASPYFMDETGKARYLPEAADAFGTGADTISDALTDYFPDAQRYLASGTGGVDAKTIYKNALKEAQGKADQGTQGFDAQTRANALLGDARSAVKGGLGSFDAKESFDRRTGRAESFADQGVGKFDPSSVSDFMNPYQEQVMDAALAKIDREGAKARQAGAAKAIGQGAFGGSRAGVQAAETERAIAEQRQNTIAGLMSQGYDKAMAGAAATDENSRIRALKASGLAGDLGSRGTSAEQNAYEDAAKRGIAGGQQLGGFSATQLGSEGKSFEGAEGRMLKAADMYRSMGLSSADAQAKAAGDEKKRSLEAGRLTGGLGSAVGNLGSAEATIGRGYGALAGTSADIGSGYAGMAPSDLNFMYGLGGKQREYDQQYNNYARQNQLNYTQEVLAPYSYSQNFLTGAPSASMYGQFTQKPSQSPNPFLQGVGMYATYQGAQGR